MRGRVLTILQQDVGLGLASGLYVGGISANGLKHLALHAANGFQIEFVLMSSMVAFTTRLLGVDGDELRLAIPIALNSIERRKDARHQMTLTTRAYVRVAGWRPDLKDLAAPPFFDYQRDQSSLLHIGDISNGGISIVSRFPIACSVVKKGVVLDRGDLVLPMAPAIPVSMEVRWVKKIRESLSDERGRPKNIRVYKFGILFLNPSERLMTEIQKFIARLSVADAI